MARLLIVLRLKLGLTVPIVQDILFKPNKRLTNQKGV